MTLVSSRARGARANSGRLGYPKNSEIVARDAAGRITAARLECPYRVPYVRVEVADANGGLAWTNPIWLS